MENILSVIENRVQRISFNRPDKKNAITPEMYLCLDQLLQEAQNNNDVAVVMLDSSSEAFTSGNDLKSFLESPEENGRLAFDFLNTLIHFPKPIICAVSGLAVGIGTTLLLHADLVFASKEAWFQLPFINLGLTPEAASTLLLPKLAGWHKAAELLLTGDSFSAKDAQEIGLVNALHSAEALPKQAMYMAEKIAQQPLNGLIATKQLMKAPLIQQIDEANQREGKVFSECLQSPEAKAMMGAFFKS